MSRSPSTVITENATEATNPAISTNMIAGAVLPADSGEANKPIIISSSRELKKYGKPTEKNYMFHKIVEDIVVGNKPVYVIRPLSVNAKNAQLELRGTSKLKASSHFGVSNAKKLGKAQSKFFNRDVAGTSINYEYSTEYKLSFIRRYVTANNDMAIAVCSHDNHYNQPIFQNKKSVIRSLAQETEPLKPKKYEKYVVKRTSMDVVITDTTTVTIAGVDLTDELKVGDIFSDGTTTDLAITAISYTSPNTIITTVGAANDATKIDYLLGDNWNANDTFIDGSIVEYDGTNWGILTLTTGDQYYVENEGSLYEYNGSAWIKKTDKYNPIDTNYDGRINYAIRDIFSNTILNSDGSIMSFNDLYPDPITFDNGEILIVVVRKNDDGLWSLSETVFGNYNRAHLNDRGETDFIETIAMKTSSDLYIKVGSNSYDVDTITVGEKKLIIEDTDLRYISTNEKIMVSDLVKGGVTTPSTEFTVDSVTLNGTNTEVIVVEDLTGYTLSATSKLDDSKAGLVSTNISDEGNVFSLAYDVTSSVASDGYDVEGTLLYDTAPVDGDGSTIVDYSDVENEDIDNAANVFLDTDNVSVDLLASYCTIDEYGNYHQNKMCVIANSLPYTHAISSGWDIRDWDFSSRSESTKNIVSNYGNLRSNKYTGSMTTFSKNNSPFEMMKQSFDSYSKKDRWYPVTGDIIRMIMDNDLISFKGGESPIAGDNAGELLNQNALTPPPKQEDRDTLSKNGINYYVISKTSGLPIIFENLTSYEKNVPVYKGLSYRIGVNLIKKFIITNLFPFYFKYKTTETRETLYRLFDKEMKKYTNRGSVDSYSWTYPADDEFSDTQSMSINVEVVFNSVIKHFKIAMNLSLTMDADGINIVENS